MTTAPQMNTVVSSAIPTRICDLGVSPIKKTDSDKRKLIKIGLTNKIRFSLKRGSCYGRFFFLRVFNECVPPGPERRRPFGTDDLKETVLDHVSDLTALSAADRYPVHGPDRCYLCGSSREE